MNAVTGPKKVICGPSEMGSVGVAVRVTVWVGVIVRVGVAVRV